MTVVGVVPVGEVVVVVRVSLGVGFGFPLDQVEAGGGSDLVVVLVSGRLVVV